MVMTMVPAFQLPEVTECYSATKGEIIVQGSVASVEIYLLNGMKVYTERVTSEAFNIPSANLPKGICLVSVITQNGETTTRKMLIN